VVIASEFLISPSLLGLFLVYFYFISFQSVQLDPLALYFVLGTWYLVHKKHVFPPNVLPACFFNPFRGVVDVFPEEEVELPYMVLHVPQVVEEDFEDRIIHGFGFIDPALGSELLIQT
jgi:hypothetical protein